MNPRESTKVGKILVVHAKEPITKKLIYLGNPSNSIEVKRWKEESSKSKLQCEGDLTEVKCHEVAEVMSSVGV